MLFRSEGDGRATVYAGGWTDYRSQRGVIEMEEVAAKTLAPKDKTKSEAKRTGLSFTEKHRLEALPGIIAKLEAEINKLTDMLSDADMFHKEPVKFRKGSEGLTERQTALAKAEEEWLELEEKSAR